MKKVFIAVFLLSVLNSCSKYNKTYVGAEQHIYLVRHSEKADDGTKDPPLSEIGHATSKSLAQQLKGKKITRIFSSDYKRTRMTAEYLSKEIDIPIELYDPRDLATFSASIKAINEEHILIVGHSNTTPSLANMILGTDTFKQFEESEYSNLIIISKGKKEYKGEMSSIVR